MRLFDQLASILGAVFILTAYVALQHGRLSRESRAFNAINLAGSLLLTYSAIRTWNAGFIILEGSWALLSIPGTIRRQTAR